MGSQSRYALDIARTLVRKWREETGQPLTSDILRKILTKAAENLEIKLHDTEARLLVRKLETIFTTWIDKPQTLDDGKHVPWLPQRMTEINWFYWERYRRLLVEQGWAEATIEKLDEITRETLGRLEDPNREDAWDIRGVVVGHVQSGKTANYIGLICRAIDAGYKVIVVLAGIHNSLRSQTQIRLDEGLLGFDSVHNLNMSNREPIGVGTIAHGHPIDTITTRLEDGDFRQVVARQFSISPGGHPLLFVVKKNGSVLKNLVSWVGWAARGNKVEGGRPLVQGVPLLVIDDEADYGSVDTKHQRRDHLGKIDEDHDPTVINRRIRQLLFYFQKSAYVGYTATPFANIYIHHQSRVPKYGDDLFPRNFITALPAPSNHIGPARVFGIRSDPDADIEEQEGLPVVRPVKDAGDWMPPMHKMEHLPRYAGSDELPPSLREAIMAFILSCAARRARGEESAHNSMLVHVTRFVAVQECVHGQVRRELANIQRRLQHGDGESRPTLLDELAALWDNDFVPTTAAIADPECTTLSWKDVAPYVLKAAMAITEVRQINGSAGDVLDYIEHRQTGLNVIAVGGDKLSRGLTLEGLTVSYFLRNSRMYDTLMQMGRWFGYRPGYLDLCRLYTTEDLRDWLRDITFANEELQQEFNHMVAVGGKPSDYGLRVRSHPQLLVTARVKMRQGTKLQISFAGSICETVVFHKKATFIEDNYDATKSFLLRLTAKGCGPSKPSQPRPLGGTQVWAGFCWKNAPSDEVCRFLRKYSTHEDARKVDGNRLADYIEKQFQSPRHDLANWTVYLAAGSGKDYSILPGASIRLVERDWHPDFAPRKHGPQPFYRIRRLLSPADEFVDIGPDAWNEALKATILAWQQDTRPTKRPTRPEQPAGHNVRLVRQTTDGLLLLYPLVPDVDRSDLGPDGPPIVGIGVSFPGNRNDEKITYIVNPVFKGQEYGDLE